MEFDDARCGTVLFEDDEEHSFKVEVHKEQERDLACDDGWEKYITG